MVIGAGHAAGQLASSLRMQKFAGDITVFGDEPYAPYQRPPLSKKFLSGELDREKLYFKPEAFYAEHDIKLATKTRVMEIDRKQQQITTEQGVTAYDHLVIATGTKVRRLQTAGHHLGNIFYLRTIDDVEAIRTRLAADKKVLVCGGGYIGLEVAAIASQLNAQVTLLEREDRLLSRVVPDVVSDFFTQLHNDHGVNIKTGVTVDAFGGTSVVDHVVLSDGSKLDVDMVIVGIGVIPNTELAIEAGLKVENGIVVDAQCRTSDAVIYAIGDCASFYSPLYDRHIRLESVPNALGQARVVAAQIMGQEKIYDDLPWFWSDQYDKKLQIAGLSQFYTDYVVRGEIAKGQFSVFYFDQDRLLAVDAINSPAEFMQSKKLIQKQCKLDKQQLADPDVDFKALALSASA